MPSRRKVTKKMGAVAGSRDYDTFARLCPVEQDPVLTVLRAHLLTEYYLEQLIRLLVPRGDRLLEGSFSYAQKLVLVDGFDLVERGVIDALRNLNKMRNRCAHEMDREISFSDVELIGRSLGTDFTEAKHKHLGDVKGFLNTIIFHIQRLLGEDVFGLEMQHLEDAEAEET